ERGQARECLLIGGRAEAKRHAPFSGPERLRLTVAAGEAMRDGRSAEVVQPRSGEGIMEMRGDHGARPFVCVWYGCVIRLLSGAGGVGPLGRGAGERKLNVRHRRAVAPMPCGARPKRWEDRAPAPAQARSRCRGSLARGTRGFEAQHTLAGSPTMWGRS